MTILSSDLRGSIYRLTELAELELLCPACPDPPPEFHETLAEDVRQVRQFLNQIRPPAGDWFWADPPDKRGRAGKVDLLNV